MAEQPRECLTIIWEPMAKEEWKNVLGYYFERNGTIDYSLKLDDKRSHALYLLSMFPEMGEPTAIDCVRAHAVENYAVIYRATETRLEVLAVRDARREPED